MTEGIFPCLRLSMSNSGSLLLNCEFSFDPNSYQDGLSSTVSIVTINRVQPKKSERVNNTAMPDRDQMARQTMITCMAAENVGE